MPGSGRSGRRRGRISAGDVLAGLLSRHGIARELREHRILARDLGDPPLVREIRFHVGPRQLVPDDDALAPTLRIRRKPQRLRQPPPAPTAERLAAIEREAERIGDAELRAIVVDVRRRWDL